MEADEGAEMVEDAQEELIARDDSKQRKKDTKRKKGKGVIESDDDDSLLQIDEFSGSQTGSPDTSFDQKESTLNKIVPPQAVRQRYDYNAFSNVNFPTVGKTIDIEDLKAADNTNTEGVNLAVENLYRRMVDVDQNSQGQQFVQKDCHVIDLKNEESSNQNLYTDESCQKLLHQWSGDVTGLFQRKMEDVLESQIEVEYEDTLTKKSMTHSFKIVKYQGTQYFILCEYIAKSDPQSPSKDGTISLKILKNNTEMQRLEEIHSVSINQVEDAVCTPPGSIVKQNGRYIYYFKISGGQGGQNVDALLMKFDLQDEREHRDPIRNYKLHDKSLDNPLYIQFADDGYEFDPKNHESFETEIEDHTFIDQCFVAIQTKVSIQRSMFSIRSMKKLEDELKIIKSDCFTYIHFFTMTPKQASNLGVSIDFDTLVCRHIIYKQQSIFQVLNKHDQVQLRDVDAGETKEMGRNFEILEKMLYIDTFFKSTLTTFDRQGGKDIRSKEINSFVAQSFNNILAKDQIQSLDQENNHITISIDHGIQKLIFIWQQTNKKQDSYGDESFYRIRQYKMGQNYQQILQDQPEQDDTSTHPGTTNPVLELIEECGPLNISKKYPNVARTIDGICAFSPDDTLSFRFENSFQFSGSRTIIPVSRNLNSCWCLNGEKKQEGDFRQDIRSVMLKQNSVATLYQRHFKNFLLMHVPSGDVYTLRHNKKYDPLNKDPSSSFNQPIVVKPSNYDKPVKSDIQIKFQEYFIQEDDMQEVPVVAGSDSSSNLYLLMLDLKKRKVLSSSFIWTPEEFDYTFDYEGLSLNQSSDIYQVTNKKQTSYCKNYQVTIQNESLNVLLIYEFRVSWTEADKHNPKSSKNFKYNVSVNQISQKQIYFSTRPQVTFMRVVPKFDSQYNVSGTNIFEFKQLSDQASENDLELLGEYSTSDSLSSQVTKAQIRNHIVSSSYTKFLNEEGGVSAILVESSMTEEFLNNNHFMQYEQFVLLYNQNITILNMIPKDLKNLVKLNQRIRVGDALKKMEILEGNCVSDFLIGQPQMLSKMLQDSENLESPSEFKSLLEQILENDGKSSKRLTFLKDHGILRERNSLSFDFTFKSILERCMQGFPGYLESAEVIFKHLLSKPKTAHNQMLLMSVLSDVLNQPTKLRHFFKFFESSQLRTPDEDPSLLCFKSSLPAESSLPSTSPFPLLTQKIKFQDNNYYSDLEDLCSKQIYESQVQGLQQYEMKHEYIDFWGLILKEKIRAVGASKAFGSEMVRFEINDYVVSCFMERIMAYSSESIESQSIVKKIIDDQFEDTQWQYRKQMLGYLFFFHIPFVIQVFVKDKLVLIICLLSCLIISCISAFDETVKMRSRVAGLKQGILTWFNIGTSLLSALFFVMKAVSVLNSGGQESQEQQQLMEQNLEIQNLMKSNIYLVNSLMSSEQIQPDFNNAISLEGASGGNSSESPELQRTFAIFQFLIFVLSVVKIFILLRVSNERVGKVFLMMGAVHSQVKIYIRLLISWALITSLGLRMLNVKFEGNEDIKFLRILEGIFKGFVGDIQNIEIEDENSDSFIITLAWATWFLNIAFGQILLLNFFVALIFQAYESSMSVCTEQKYLFRSQVNKERLFLQQSFGLLEPFDCMVVSSQKYDDSNSEEWQGIVHTIKQNLDFQASQIKGQIHEGQVSNQKNSEKTADISDRMLSLEIKMDKILEKLQ